MFCFSSWMASVKCIWIIFIPFPHFSWREMLWGGGPHGILALIGYFFMGHRFLIHQLFQWSGWMAALTRAMDLTILKVLWPGRWCEWPHGHVVIRVEAGVNYGNISWETSGQAAAAGMVNDPFCGCNIGLVAWPWTGSVSWLGGGHDVWLQSVWCANILLLYLIWMLTLCRPFSHRFLCRPLHLAESFWFLRQKIVFI